MTNFNNQAQYKMKFSRIWERYDEADSGNAVHMREILEQAFDALETAERHIAITERVAREKLEAKDERIAELSSAVIAPGVMRCAGCGFVLTKNNISMSAGAITAGDSKTEPCPNGCGPLWPVTWKEQAIQFRDDSEQWFEELQEARQRIAELSGEFFALPPLNDELIAILGRPNFTCAHLAELLRKGGQDIRRKAECEQAAVIYWFLDLYLKYGDKWESIANDDIQSRVAMITAGTSKGE